MADDVALAPPRRSLAPRCDEDGCERLPIPGGTKCGACLAAMVPAAREKLLGPLRAVEQGWAELSRNDDAVRAQLARTAFADVRMLLAEDGTFLSPELWPAEAWRTVAEVEFQEARAGKGDKPGAEIKPGVKKVKFESKLAALRELAKLNGGAMADREKSAADDELIRMLGVARSGGPPKPREPAVIDVEAKPVPPPMPEKNKRRSPVEKREDRARAQARALFGDDDEQ